MKREAKFNSWFNKWVKNVYKKTAAFELKQTQTNSLPFSALAEHQKQALYAVKHSTFVHKIIDAGFQNPFDSFSLSEVPAFIVVKYPDFWCMIDIDVWIHEEENSERKSITSERAKTIAHFCAVV